MIGREGRMRDKECRRKKSMLRQRILGDGRGVEDRFWKYRRSNRPDSQMRGAPSGLSRTSAGL